MEHVFAECDPDGVVVRLLKRQCTAECVADCEGACACCDGVPVGEGCVRRIVSTLPTGNARGPFRVVGDEVVADRDATIRHLRREIEDWEDRLSGLRRRWNATDTPANVASLHASSELLRSIEAVENKLANLRLELDEIA